MANKEIIEIKNISDIKSNIVNYDVFDNKIAIATEKDEIFMMEYNIDIEQEIITRIENLASRLENNSKIVDKDIKLFNKGLIFVIMYTLMFVVLSILLSSPIPLIFLIPAGFIGNKLICIIKDYKKEFKQTNFDLYILKSTLDIKKMKFEQKMSAKQCRDIISEQSNKKGDSKLLKELRQQLVQEESIEKDKTLILK